VLLRLWTGSWPTAAALGIALSMSSTAFVMQLLAERNQDQTAHGRTIFAVLLHQDLLVPPMLAILPLLAITVIGPHAVALATAVPAGVPAVPIEAAPPAFGLATAALAMLLVFVAAKLLLEGMLSAVREPAKHDAFPAAILTAPIVMGWIAHALGLSPSFGAFLAGLALAGVEWRDEVKTVIRPFESTLLAFSSSASAPSSP